jgi:hypothetical protein
VQVSITENRSERIEARLERENKSTGEREEGQPKIQVEREEQEKEKKK